MKLFFSYLLTPIFFLFFGLTLGIFHIVQIITLRVFGKNAHDGSVALLNYCLMKCLLILGTRIRFKNFVKLPTDRPILVISNHQSMWDIPPVVWKLRNKHPKYIAKASLSRFIPSISYNLKHGGSVTIDRNKPAEAIEKIGKFAQYIKQNNYSICIYPEGTRSRDGKIKPFKVSGVEAILKKIPDIMVVPIAIKNTGLIDNDGRFNKRLGIRPIFTMLKSRTISLDNLTGDLEAIRQEIALTIR